MTVSLPGVKRNRGTRTQVTFMLDDDQARALSAIATLRRTTFAAVAREAVDAYLRHHNQPIHLPQPVEEISHA